MKKIISVTLVLALFVCLNMATTKTLNLPCEGPIYRYLEKDTITNAYYLGSTHDTVMIVVYKDTLLDKISADLCSMLKDSCKMNGFKIQIRDTTSDPAQWNTPYGKQIYFKTCP